MDEMVVHCFLNLFILFTVIVMAIVFSFYIYKLIYCSSAIQQFSVVLFIRRRKQKPSNQSISCPYVYRLGGSDCATSTRRVCCSYLSSYYYMRIYVPHPCYRVHHRASDTTPLHTHMTAFKFKHPVTNSPTLKTHTDTHTHLGKRYMRVKLSSRCYDVRNPPLSVPWTAKECG